MVSLAVDMAPQVAVRNTFLCDVSPLSGRPRSLSVEPPAVCDRYAVMVHALMFQHEAVHPRSPPKSSVGGASLLGVESVDPCSEASTIADTESEDSASAVSSRRAGRHGPGTSSDASNQSCEKEEEDSEEAPSSEGNGIDALLAQESVESLLQRVPRDQQGSLTSIGSIVHEEGTCKPCVFAHNERKACQNGVNCHFCHFAHPPKRRMRYCKKKRMEMKRLAEHDEQ